MAKLIPVGEMWGVFVDRVCYVTFRTRKEAKRFIAWTMPGFDVA